MHKIIAEARSIVRVQTWSLEMDIPRELLAWWGNTWPDRVGVVTQGNAAASICVGPTEWLTLSSNDDRNQLVQNMTIALKGSTFKAIDVSQSLIQIRILGEHSRSVLEKGCSLDFAVEQFKVGGSSRTRVAAIPVLIWRRAEDEFVCLVARSYREYFQAWLDDASMEYLL
jgi:sarcosine oxidase subunit gamma